MSNKLRRCLAVVPTGAIALVIGLAAVTGGAFQGDPAAQERTLAEIVITPLPLRNGIGIVRERVTTASPEASAFYNQGLAYLHSFVWIEAARSFNQALRLDQNFAMANVGLSYAVGELGLSAQARQASDRAQRLERSISPRERLMIELRKLQLDASALPNQTPPQTAYKKRLDDAIASFPDDVELLLLIGQAQDSTHDDHGMSVGSASLPFYLKALTQSPDDFATHHLLAHAYENIKQFDQALVHAKRYAEQADAVPHAHHMYGHVLRRLNRMTEAIAEFERADQLEVAYLRSESIPPRFDWHYRHNLSLLGSSYQYVGRLASAEAALRRSSEIDGVTPTEIDLDRQQLVTLLLARQAPLDALAAARALAARPQPIEQALGHLLAGRALLALKRPEDAAGEGNLALARMRAAGPSGGMLVPEYELLQGEFLLRTGQSDSGRAMLRSAAAKLHDASGPDAWVKTLFSLEAIVRAGGDLGDWPLARDFTEKMRDLDATYPGTEFALGRLAEHDGQRDVALGHYQKAVGGWSAADRDFPPRLDAQAGINRLRR